MFSLKKENTIKHKHVFVIGLHRSGTTLLANLIANHPYVSSFKDTGFPKDEGQFLQTVYPPAYIYGGPGKFGFDLRTHLDESSHLLTKDNKEKLFSEWSKHWDMSRKILLEKSPPNLLKTRFLQEIFPNTKFIMITRHPIAVSYATQKWSKTSIVSLLEHWLICHEIFEADRKHLENVFTLKYKDLVSNPDHTIMNVYNFIGLPIFTNTPYYPEPIYDNIDQKYFNLWEKEYTSLSKEEKNRILLLEKRLNHFSYSLNVDHNA